MRRLNVPVPPMLEAALGYEGDADWVGFYWEPAGDEVVYDDARQSGTGEWHAWVIFTRCPKVAPALAGLELGNSDEAARHWLVLSRSRRELHAAEVAEARRFLRDQWPREESVVLTEEQVQAVMDHIREAMDARPMPTQQEIREAMARQNEIERQLAEWLGRAEVPGPDAGNGEEERR